MGIAKTPERQQEPETTRMTRRRDKIHSEILEVASKLICEKGSAAVSLDEISRYADVARKTVYNHFENKEALIHELVMPICDHAKEYLIKLDSVNTPSLDDLWNYCLELWEVKELNAALLYQITEEDYSHIKESRQGFIYVFSKMLERISEYSHLSAKEIASVAEIIYDTYVPLLLHLSNQDSYHQKFRRAMTGMIQGILEK